MGTLILNFSGRRDGNCYSLARLVRELTGEGQVVDFCGLDPQPCGKCGYECFRGGECPMAEDGLPGLYEKIAGAEEVVFLVPDYCGYPCANFFIFNERGCSYFAGRQDRLDRFLCIPKRFVVVSGSESGAFRDAFRYLIAEGEPRVLYLSARKYGRDSLAGDLVRVPAVAEAVREFLK